jgi:hypothetical protein
MGPGPRVAEELRENCEAGRVAEALSDMGISLIDPAPQIAAMITDVRHFKTVLRSNPPVKRRKAYDALRPHLSFEVPEYDLLWESAKQRKKRLKRERCA